MSRNDNHASRAVEVVRKRYNRVAGLYGLFERLTENSRLARWRALLWSKVEGTNILEVGAGSGANMPYYPGNAEITAIDISDKMLARACSRARRLGLNVAIERMDLQQLRFADNTFDTVVASLVFCTVLDPERGFAEVRRVCKIGGKVVLLEHEVARGRVAAFLMNMFNWFPAWVLSDHINRRTIESARRVGLVVEKVTDLGGVFRLIEARKKT